MLARRSESVSSSSPVSVPLALAPEWKALLLRSSGADEVAPFLVPFHATVDELAGLPPHLISVNQLDPLRDEGVAYYHKLNRAGVTATLRTVTGVCHAADIMLPGHMPDAYEATITSIH